MKRPRASAPKTEPRMIASLCPPLPSDFEAEGMAVPVSAVAPKIEDVPMMGDIPEEADDAPSDVDRADVEALPDCEAVDDAELELASDRLEGDVPDELRSELEVEVSSSLDVVEVLLSEDSVVG